MDISIMAAILPDAQRGVMSSYARIEQVKRELVDYGTVSDASAFVLNKPLKDLLDFWRVYLDYPALDKTCQNLYWELKRKFLAVFNEKVFEEYLNYTYYFRTNFEMRKKGLVDFRDYNGMPVSVREVTKQ